MSQQGKHIWYVVYTKSRNEKKVYQSFLNRGIECYCPLRKELKIWSDRKKWVEEPVFKSYIFVKKPVSEKEKLEILSIPGVVRFLFWLGKPAEVRESEIITIKRFLGEYQKFEVVSYSLGDVVEVDSGAFKGRSGIVIEESDNFVSLQIEKLGMNLKAKLPKCQIK